MKMAIRRASAFACALFALTSALAADRIWTGAQNDSVRPWSHPSNWVGGIVPVNGDRLIFPAGAIGKYSTNDFIPPRAFEALVFQDPEGHIAYGSSVTLTGDAPIVVEASAGTFTMGVKMTLASANPVVTVRRPSGSTGGEGPRLVFGTGPSSTDTLTLSPGTARFDAPDTSILFYTGPTASAATTVVVSGSRVEFDGQNLFGASVRSEASLLKVSGVNGMGAASAPTTVAAGRISVGPFNPGEDPTFFDEPLDLQAPPQPDQGNVESVVRYFRGAITLTGTQTFVAPWYTFEGPISGSGTLRLKVDLGQYAYLMNAGNSFTGGVELVRGMLALVEPERIPDAGALTIGPQGWVDVGMIGYLSQSPTTVETVRRLDCQGAIQFGRANIAWLRVLEASSIAGCRLYIQITSWTVPPAEIPLVRNESGVPFTGAFANAPEGTTFTLNGAVMRLTYHGGSGNDIALVMQSAPPVPAALQVVSGAPQAISTYGPVDDSLVVRAVDAQGRPVANVRVRFEMPACFHYPSGDVTGDRFTSEDGTVWYSPFAESRQTGICKIRAVVPDTNVAVDLPMHIYNWGEISIVPLQAAIQVAPGQAFGFGFELRHPSGMSLPRLRVYYRVEGQVGGADATVIAYGESGSDSRVPGTAIANGGTGSYRVIGSNYGQEGAITVTQSKEGQPVAPQVQDMWWGGPAENGWGMSLIQHGETIFATIYGYDAQGAATWYVMPGGSWNAAKTAYTGSVYVPQGSPFYAYDAARYSSGLPVGTMTMTFTDADHGTLSYTIYGVTRIRSIERNRFALSGSAPLTGLGDMWWGGPSQNGWGTVVLQQFGMIFSVWFTYDANGAPTWYFMSDGRWIDATTYEGALYRTTGSPWLAPTYDPKALQVTPVGTFRYRFNGSTATFDYTVDGRSGSVPLERLGF